MTCFLPFPLSAQNSVNSQEPKIPYPWLVFNDKVKVNSVFLRDSTAVSDSVVLLFGGSVYKGGLVSFLLLFILIIASLHTKGIRNFLSLYNHQPPQLMAYILLIYG